MSKNDPYIEIKKYLNSIESKTEVAFGLSLLIQTVMTVLEIDSIFITLVTVYPFVMFTHYYKNVDTTIFWYLNH